MLQLPILLHVAASKPEKPDTQRCFVTDATLLFCSLSNISGPWFQYRDTVWFTEKLLFRFGLGFVIFII